MTIRMLQSHSSTRGGGVVDNERELYTSYIRHLEEEISDLKAALSRERAYKERLEARYIFGVTPQVVTEENSQPVMSRPTMTREEAARRVRAFESMKIKERTLSPEDKEYADKLSEENSNQSEVEGSGKAV